MRLMKDEDAERWDTLIESLAKIGKVGKRLTHETDPDIVNKWELAGERAIRELTRIWRDTSAAYDVPF